VIACHCREVDDRTVRAAVLAGADGIDDLAARCGAGAECGGCHRTLERLLREHRVPCEGGVPAVA
jgi:bacterioferritin-associated ferredoxin